VRPAAAHAESELEDEMLTNQLRLPACCLVLGAAGSAAAENYEVGQVWSYRTRPQEPDSTLMMLRIDNTSKLGQVVFIGLKDVRIKHPSGGGHSFNEPAAVHQGGARQKRRQAGRQGGQAHEFEFRLREMEGGAIWPARSRRLTS
jgi:hypothetical protein